MSTSSLHRSRPTGQCTTAMPHNGSSMGLGLLLRTGLLITIALLLAACDARSLIPPSRDITIPTAEITPVESQVPPVSLSAHLPPGQPVSFERISLEHGLSQSSVFSILQDSKGYMWFGTQDGLNRYDGYEFVTYKPTPLDPNSLSHSTILSLAEDRQGLLWIGTNGGGLNTFDLETGQFSNYPGDRRDEHSFSGTSILVIHPDRDGSLWIGTERGLNHADPARMRFTFYEHNEDDPASLGGGAVQAIYQDSEGILWIGTEAGGLSRFDPSQETVTHYRHDSLDADSLSSDSVLSLFQDSAGTLWIGTDGGGLNRFDPATEGFVHYKHSVDDPHSLSSDSVRAIHQDRYGDLWIGTTDQGLNRYDPVREQFIRYHHDLGNPNSLGDDWIRSIYKDRAGVLWIGTVGAGLSKTGCSGGAFVHYQADAHNPDSLGENFVWSVYEDRQGSLWIGTFDSGLDKFERATGRWYHYRHSPDDPYSLSSDIVRAIQGDPQGMLWIGTQGGGLNRLDPETGRFVHYRYDPDDTHTLSSDDVFSILGDQTGTIWIGSGNGLNKLDRATGHFVQYDTNQGEVRAILKGSAGLIWFGTAGNLNVLDPATGKIDSFSLGDPVLSIHESRTRSIWVGTFSGGLIKFDPSTQRFTRYREQEGLPSDVVYGILEDERGHLWLSTNVGLSQFDPVAESFTNFDVNDGLQSNEFNAGAYFRAHTGELFFGGVNGLNAFYPDAVAVNTYQPPVVLTALTQGGLPVVVDRPIDSVREVTFKWPNNFFEFGFAALNYCQPARNEYAYMLEGLDKDWLYVGSQRTGRYTSLPGKSYTLRIKGSNNNGVWNEQGIALKVTVVPPFWATWWFRGAIVMVLVGGVIVGVRLRVRAVEARSHELEKQVAERTHALAERTREIERRTQELEALYRADAELHRHLSLDEVLQALVDIAVDILQADKSSLIAWNEEKELLIVRVARGYHPQTLADMTFGPGQGTVGYVAATGKPVAVSDAAADPRVSKRVSIIEPEGIRSFMQVPIKVGGEVFGVFSADYMQPRAFGPDEKRLFLALAQRAALAIDTAQLHEQSREVAVLQERGRLARDLHDAVTQTLFSSSLIAESLPELWSRDPQEGRELLKELRQLTRGALAEMRTLLLELRPAALEESNLSDLLRQLGDAAAGRIGIPVSVVIEGTCVLPCDIHVALYRIAQEALNNIVKHAQADQVQVSLKCAASSGPSSHMAPAEVELHIVDNGRGFDPNHVPPDRLGLGIIRERAQSIGATLKIHSQPGYGTEIIVRWQEKEFV